MTEIAVLLMLAAPPGTPEPMPDCTALEASRALNDAMRSVGIVRGTETFYCYDWRGESRSWQSQVDFAREVWHDLSDAPHEDECWRLPPLEECRVKYALAVELARTARTQQRFDPMGWAGVPETADRHAAFWLLAATARHEGHATRTRRSALKAVRETVGWDRWFNGEWPQIR